MKKIDKVIKIIEKNLLNDLIKTLVTELQLKV